MFFIHVFLATLFHPLVIIIILFFWGILKNKKNLIIITVIVLYVFSIPLFSNNLFSLLEGRELRKSPNNIDSCDAVVVLSGMLNSIEINNKSSFEWDDPDRFFGGIELIQAQKSSRLIFTGGRLRWGNGSKKEGDLLKQCAITYGLNPQKISITVYAENTKDEAVAVKELLNPLKKIILVTSAYHMHRAKMLFEKEGFEVITYPVDFKTHRPFKIHWHSFFPSAGSFHQTEDGIHEILGIIYYSILN